MPRVSYTFLDHVRELRLRLLITGLFFVGGAVLAYVVHTPILEWIHAPYHQALYYTTPAGAFNLTMKISILGGIVVAIPAAVYSIIAFVQPALAKRLTKSELRLITILSLVLGLSGVLFAYYAIVPMSLSFFGKFNVQGFQSLISANDYVNLIINCLIAFVIIFQLPLLILTIDRIRPLPPKRLLHYERYVIVGSLILALILPFTYDPITQFLVALPVVILYNVSILLVVWSHATHRHDKQTMAPVHRPVDERPMPVVAMEVPATQPIMRPRGLVMDAVRASSSNRLAVDAVVKRSPPRPAQTTNRMPQRRSSPVMDIIPRSRPSVDQIISNNPAAA